MLGGTGKTVEVSCYSCESKGEWLSEDGEGVQSDEGTKPSKPTEGEMPRNNREQDFRK